MNAAVGLMDGLGLDGDRCIRMIPRHIAWGSFGLFAPNKKAYVNLKCND